MGYELRDRIGPEAEAEIRLKTKRHRGTRGVLKLEARYFRDNTQLERAYVEHELSERLEFRLGLDKKRLGLEYEQGNRERLATERSLLYQQMEALGLVGRQLSARVSAEPIDDLYIDATLGVDGSRNGNVLLRTTREPGNIGYGTWLLLQRHRVDKDYVFVWAQAISGWYISGRARLVIELIAGIDPVRTELERLLGNRDRVFFGGPKIELARRFAVRPQVTIEPLVQASIAWHELGDADHNTIEAVLGINLYVWDLLVAVEGHYYGAREQNPPGERKIRWPNFLLQARYYY